MGLYAVESPFLPKAAVRKCLLLLRFQGLSGRRSAIAKLSSIYDVHSLARRIGELASGAVATAATLGFHCRKRPSPGSGARGFALEQSPIRLTISRICQVCDAFSFGDLIETRGDGLAEACDGECAVLERI